MDKTQDAKTPEDRIAETTQALQENSIEVTHVFCRRYNNKLEETVLDFVHKGTVYELTVLQNIYRLKNRSVENATEETYENLQQCIHRIKTWQEIVTEEIQETAHTYVVTTLPNSSLAGTIVLLKPENALYYSDGTHWHRMIEDPFSSF